MPAYAAILLLAALPLWQVPDTPTQGDPPSPKQSRRFSPRSTPSHPLAARNRRPVISSRTTPGSAMSPLLTRSMAGRWAIMEWSCTPMTAASGGRPRSPV